MIKFIAITFLLAVSAAQASNFLPIYPGNHWVYQAESGETFEIVVNATPIFVGGHVYHELTGYATEPLYVRSEGEKVYWLNEEEDRDEILTDFEPSSGGTYNTPISALCTQTAQAQERPVEYEGAGGTFPNAREIRYQVFDCADTGVESELYVENIGLVRRVNQTIAGPREFNLTTAKVGPLTLNERPGVSFRMSIPTSWIRRERPGAAVDMEVTMDLLVDRLEPLPLRYLTSQRYDIAVKDERGEIVYLWSSTALFAPVISEEQVLARHYAVPLTLSLPDGQYTIEAWLTTDSRERQFASTASFTILTEGPAESRAKVIRARR